MIFEKIPTVWKVVVVIAGIAAAGAALAREWDGLTSAVAANTQGRMLQTYDVLLRKLKAEGRLDPRDAVAFCQAAAHLGIGGPEVRAVCK